MAVTKSIEEIVRDKVTRAIEKHAENITSSNTNQIFKYTTYKSKVTWVVQCCTVCRKPNFMHQNPWDEHRDVEPITQIEKGEYIDQLENHERLKQIARLFEPRQTPRTNLDQERFRENTTWERDNRYEEEYRVNKKTKIKNLEFSEEVLQKEEYRVDKKTKFKEREFNKEDMKGVLQKVEYKANENLEFSEEVFWHKDRQLDDFFSQNPREKENMEDWWRSLSLEELKRILNNEQKLGRFKPRNLTEREWREESMKEDEEDEYEEDDEN
jgi:hypothetical protein